MGWAKVADVGRGEADFWLWRILHGWFSFGVFEFSFEWEGKTLDGFEQGSDVLGAFYLFLPVRLSPYMSCILPGFMGQSLIRPPPSSSLRFCLPSPPTPCPVQLNSKPYKLGYRRRLLRQTLTLLEISL